MTSPTSAPASSSAPALFSLQPFRYCAVTRSSHTPVTPAYYATKSTCGGRVRSGATGRACRRACRDGDGEDVFAGYAGSGNAQADQSLAAGHRMSLCLDFTSSVPTPLPSVLSTDIMLSSANGAPPVLVRPREPAAHHATRTIHTHNTHEHLWRRSNIQGCRACRRLLLIPLTEWIRGRWKVKEPCALTSSFYLYLYTYIYKKIRLSPSIRLFSLSRFLSPSSLFLPLPSAAPTASLPASLPCLPP